MLLSTTAPRTATNEKKASTNPQKTREITSGARAPPMNDVQEQRVYCPSQGIAIRPRWRDDTSSRVDVCRLQ